MEQRQFICAIFSSNDRILAHQHEGHWECSEGTTAPHSSLLEAAAGVVRESLGLEMGMHIVPISVAATELMYPDYPLHIVFFKCSNAMGDFDPIFMTKPLDVGLPSVEWQPIEQLVSSVRQEKRAAYETLLQWSGPILDMAADAAHAIDFSGTWRRDASRNAGVVEALVARGLTREEAAAQAGKPYEQSWSRSTAEDEGDEATGSWAVKTYNAGGVHGKHRLVVYPLGDWKESFEGSSVLYGDANLGSASLLRSTGWLAEPDATPAEEVVVEADEAGSNASGQPLRVLHPSCVAHTTWSSRHNKAAEITSRYMRDGCLVVRRTWLSQEGGNTPARPVTCEEVFVRQRGQGG